MSVEIHEIEPVMKKRGPLVLLEWDAYADVDGIRFWRLSRAQSTHRYASGTRYDETWYFADGPVSVHITHYPEHSAIESFTGWRVSGHAGGSGKPKFASREEALAFAPQVVRRRAAEELVRQARALTAAAEVVEMVAR